MTEFIDSIPLSLRLDFYIPLGEQHAKPPYLKQLESNYNAELSCYEIEILSTHVNQTGCFNLEKGLITLID